jgi:hypothetical protein
MFGLAARFAQHGEQILQRLLGLLREVIGMELRIWPAMNTCVPLAATPFA